MSRAKRVKPESIQRRKHALASVLGTKHADVKSFSHDDLYVSFDFSRMDKDYCQMWDWHLKPEELQALFHSILHYSKSTWGEIKKDCASGKSKHHFISISSLSKEAQKRLKQLQANNNFEYSEKVFSFRISAKVRLLGMVENNVFYALWYDRDHKVCPSHKKHT